MMKSKLTVVFNLETDSDSRLLASNLDWVKELKNNSEELWVISTRLGKNMPNIQNLHFFETGGGNLPRRLIALMKLSRIAVEVLRRRGDAVVFHHMSHRTAVFPGYFFKIFGVPQGLWFSHEFSPPALPLATKIVDVIFTPDKYCFPLETSKLKEIGQPISVEAFQGLATPHTNRDKNAFITVGRVSRSKNLEVGLKVNESLSEKENTTQILIDVFGPITDVSYARELQKSYAQAGMTIAFHGSVARNELGLKFSRYSFYISGTRRGVDRAAIEAVLSGCIPVTENIGLMRVSGIDITWKEFFENLPTVSAQVEFLLQCEDSKLDEISEMLVSHCKARNNLKHTALEIIEVLKNLKNNHNDTK